MIPSALFLLSTAVQAFQPGPSSGLFLGGARFLTKRWSQQQQQVPETAVVLDDVLDEEEMDESAKKQAEIKRLKAAEKFVELGTGTYLCKVCGYVYDPVQGEPRTGTPPGIAFASLPADWRCPTCRAQKDAFEMQTTTIAGFAENQGYGLGGNNMTEEGKSTLIFGSLAAFFALFMAGYLLN